MKNSTRIFAATDLQIDSFNNGLPNVLGSYIYNGIIRKYPGEQNGYVTQRPGINAYQLPTDYSVTDVRGRGIYYWELASDLYFVNNDTVYHTDYSAALTNTITAGNQRVNIAELGSNLVFLNAQSNEMFYINSGTDTTLRSMNTVSTSSTDVSFTAPSTFQTAGAVDFSDLNPGDTIVIGSTSGTNDGTYTVSTANATTVVVTETSITTETAVAAGTVTVQRTNYAALPQNNSLTLVPGIVVLDQTMYVGSSNGQIWGSAISDTQDWDDALNYVTAEKEPDNLVAIEKHYNDLVAFGTRTIEFFYDAGNPTGSPLSPRDDISYNIGCADAGSIARIGDDIYFLGIDTLGQIQPYVLSNHQISPISNGNLSSFLTTSQLQEQAFTTYGGAMAAGGANFYLLTTYTLQNTYDPNVTATYAYDSMSKTWSEWDFSNAAITGVPVVGYTVTNSSRLGSGIMANGELISFLDNFTPYDGLGSGGDGYIVSGYIDSTYYVTTSIANTSPIFMISRLDNWDNGNRNWKFLHTLRFVGDNTEDSNMITVLWEDGNNIPNSYSRSRTFDISSPNNKITRLGRFKSRSFEFQYQGTEQIRFKGFDIDFDEGTH